MPRDGTLLRSAVAAAQAGDHGAAHFLYASYKDNVYGYVRSLVGDEHEAEDVTQAVFAKLLVVVGRYEPRSGATFGSWLLRIAHNASMDHLRRRRRDVPEEEPHPRGAVTPPQGADTLLAALGALSEEQQRVILMRHLVGLTPGEIAERLGRSEASIHGLHHRGRQRLQEELRRTGGAPSCLEHAA
jgi:RNA polymerase sigma-70 factor (ECF subfamily)